MVSVVGFIPSFTPLSHRVTLLFYTFSHFMSTTSLTPLDPAPLAAPAAPLALPDPRDFTVTLKHDKIVDCGVSERIYWYVRGKGSKDFAMIVVKNHSATTFKVQYYPAGAEAQIVKELPIDQLDNAHYELAAAGFPFTAALKVPPAPKLPALPAAKPMKTAKVAKTPHLTAGDEPLTLTP